MSKTNSKESRNSPAERQIKQLVRLALLDFEIARCQEVVGKIRLPFSRVFDTEFENREGPHWREYCDLAAPWSHRVSKLKSVRELILSFLLRIDGSFPSIRTTSLSSFEENGL